jgi:hypothetical protein
VCVPIRNMKYQKYDALSARGSASKAGAAKGPRDVVSEPPAASGPTWALVVRKKGSMKPGKKPAEAPAGTSVVRREIAAEPTPHGSVELKREREKKAGALSLYRPSDAAARAERCASSDDSEGSPPFKSPRGSGAESMAEDEVYSDRYSDY